MGLIYYIVGTFGILIWLFIKQKESQSLGDLAKKHRYWLIPNFKITSTRWDLVIWGLRTFLARIPLSFSIALVSFKSFEKLWQALGWPLSPAHQYLASMSPQALRMSAIILGLIIYDFTLYWTHRLYHQVHWLWPFHEIHHYGTQMNYFASKREHPLDLVNVIASVAMTAALSLLPLS